MGSIFNSPESIDWVMSELYQDVCDEIDFYPKNIKFTMSHHQYDTSRVIQIIGNNNTAFNIFIEDEDIKNFPKQYILYEIRNKIKKYMLKLKKEYLIERLAGLE